MSYNKLESFGFLLMIVGAVATWPVWYFGFSIYIPFTWFVALYGFVIVTLIEYQRKDIQRHQIYAVHMQHLQYMQQLKDRQISFVVPGYVVVDMNSVSEIKERIDFLRSESSALNEKATLAYMERNFKLEDEIQKEIDKRQDEITILKNKLAELNPIQDVEVAISDRMVTHRWDSPSMDCRCDHCGMKRETFQSKAYGVKANLKDFPGEANDILELMWCKHDR